MIRVYSKIGWDRVFSNCPYNNTSLIQAICPGDIITCHILIENYCFTFSYMGFSQQLPMDARVNELVAGAAPVGGLEVSDTINSILDDLLNDHIEEIQQELVFYLISIYWDFFI